MERNIKDIIKDICKRKGTTLRALAESIGTSGDSLGTTLAKNNPTLDTLRKISKALGVPISEIVDESQRPHVNNLCPHCGKEIHISVS
ncbi:transcriptional regulator with XRE-family HTH domain [Dysgonomonas sp. PH5-45]|uniref:helix-turn-helix domain-containing protein n=1 Tax=unclassified Dysgonomonas TaxID=2630389 RepID=UPI0024747023|nr:helix-turn-helix domain-containing protein [Dysgonomonas sp. PH5-37]MDH6354708.1 transcriptional regulator with XRE-family HTH domain [Dysgonomonas sp. PH5-45]MDH6387606.1 transcriptional regulator with XRE-family HTH domain [Dysgonomonas sp. PH5-37]